MDLKKIITPFIDATVDCLVTMMDVTPTVEHVSLEVPPFEHEDLCAQIGLSGDAAGMVSLSFKKVTALELVSRFLGEKVTDMNDDVFDAVGEILNIIAGAAKAGIKEHQLSISLPSVMMGEKFVVALPRDVPIMSIRFGIPDIGPMSVLVGLRVSV